MLWVVCSRTSVSGAASVFFSLQLLGVTGVLFDVVVGGHFGWSMGECGRECVRMDGDRT